MLKKDDDDDDNLVSRALKKNVSFPNIIIQPSDNIQKIIETSSENSETINFYHSKKLEEAEIELKLQEVKLKDADTKIKLQEVEIKKIDISTKIEEVELKKQEIELKKQESELKKNEALYKYLECVRYDQETKHQKSINKSIDTTLILKNVETRLKIIYDIGMNMSSKTDFETLKRMNELLGDNASNGIINDLQFVHNKIKKDKEIIESMSR